MPISVDLQQEQIEALDRLAREDGASRASLIRAAVRNHLVRSGFAIPQTETPNEPPAA